MLEERKRWGAYAKLLNLQVKQLLMLYVRNFRIPIAFLTKELRKTLSGADGQEIFDLEAMERNWYVIRVDDIYHYFRSFPAIRLPDRIVCKHYPNGSFHVCGVEIKKSNKDVVFLDEDQIKGEKKFCDLFNIEFMIAIVRPNLLKIRFYYVEDVMKGSKWYIDWKTCKYVDEWSIINDWYGEG